MNLKQALPFLLASLAVAADDVEKTSGSLRGNAIDETQERRQAQNYWFFPWYDRDEASSEDPSSEDPPPEDPAPEEPEGSSEDPPEEVEDPAPEEPEGSSEDPPEEVEDPAPEEPEASSEDPPEEIESEVLPLTAFPTESTTAGPTVRPTRRPTATPTVEPPTFAPTDRPTRPPLPFSISRRTPEPTRGTFGNGPTRPPTVPIPPIRQGATDLNGNMCGMSTAGTAILHGGIFNYENPLSDSLGQTIVREMQTDLNNRIREPLVFLPGARRDVSDVDEATFEDQWRNIMSPGIPFTVLHADGVEPELTNVADAEEADTDAFVRPMTSAMGVFLPGGRQYRLIDAYKYTQTEEEMWKVLERGGVIAGTSAGAAVIGDYMLRGDPEGSAELIADREWHRHGFGFVSNIAIDNHVSARGRELAMYELFNSDPDNRKLLGIGLNENTMIIVKGRYFQVRGDRGPDSVVRVYDCSKIPTFSNCNFGTAPYLELTQGNWYDLCRRRQLFSAPFNNNLDEDLSRLSVAGAYSSPWTWGDDFKNGNPQKFICSGRRCKFNSSTIVVDSEVSNVVRLRGSVFETATGLGFSDSDRLQVRYRMDEDDSRTIFDTAVLPNGVSRFGQPIYFALSISPGKHIINIEIDAQTSNEGDAEFEVRNLRVVQ